MSPKGESASPVIQPKMNGKMKGREDKRKDSETFKTPALHHGHLRCHVPMCALFTDVLAVEPADVSAGEVCHSRGASGSPC